MIMSPELNDDEVVQEPGISLFVVYFSVLFRSSKLYKWSFRLESIIKINGRRKLYVMIWRWLLFSVMTLMTQMQVNIDLVD